MIDRRGSKGREVESEGVTLRSSISAKGSSPSSLAGGSAGGRRSPRQEFGTRAHGWSDCTASNPSAAGFATEHPGLAARGARNRSVAFERFARRLLIETAIAEAIEILEVDSLSAAASPPSTSRSGSWLAAYAACCPSKASTPAAVRQPHRPVRRSPAMHTRPAAGRPRRRLPAIQSLSSFHLGISFPWDLTGPVLQSIGVRLAFRPRMSGREALLTVRCRAGLVAWRRWTG